MKEMCLRIVGLQAKTGLSIKQFCDKFRLNSRNFYRWRGVGSEPIMCIPFMIEKLLYYEDMFGGIDEVPESDDVSSKLMELYERAGLPRNEFCCKFRIRMATYSQWSVGNTKPAPEIVYMIEKLLNYEDKFGEIPDPEWSTHIRHAYGIQADPL